MAERHDEGKTSEHYEETEDPQNPPNVMVSARTRNRAFWSYFGPVLAFTVVVAVALVYWLSRGPVAPSEEDLEEDTVGTAGDRTPGDADGGFNPARRPDSTQDELQFRGLDQPGTTISNTDRSLTLRSLDAALEKAAVTGGAVSVEDVEVESVDGRSFWVREGNARVRVVAPANGPELRIGMHVNVTGTMEQADGGPQIRATGIDVRK